MYNYLKQVFQRVLNKRCIQWLHTIWIPACLMWMPIAPKSPNTQIYQRLTHSLSLLPFLFHPIKLFVWSTTYHMLCKFPNGIKAYRNSILLVTCTYIADNRWLIKVVLRLSVSICEEYILLGNIDRQRPSNCDTWLYHSQYLANKQYAGVAMTALISRFILPMQYVHSRKCFCQSHVCINWKCFRQRVLWCTVEV